MASFVGAWDATPDPRCLPRSVKVHPKSSLLTNTLSTRLHSFLLSDDIRQLTFYSMCLPARTKQAVLVERCHRTSLTKPCCHCHSFQRQYFSQAWPCSHACSYVTNEVIRLRTVWSSCTTHSGKPFFNCRSSNWVTHSLSCPNTGVRSSKSSFWKRQTQILKWKCWA